MSARLGPQFQGGGLIPSAPIRKMLPPTGKSVIWWKVTLTAGGVTATRHLQTTSEDARQVASYLSRTYPTAAIVSITRMKRAPR